MPKINEENVVYCVSLGILSYVLCFNIFLPSGLGLSSHSSEGSNLTPAHHYPDFRFKTYAPLAFRYFRDLFGIKPDDYLVRP